VGGSRRHDQEGLRGHETRYRRVPRRETRNGKHCCFGCEGARQAHETVEGMNKIKRAMEAVSVRVSDLGRQV